MEVNSPPFVFSFRPEAFTAIQTVQWPSSTLTDIQEISEVWYLRGQLIFSCQAAATIGIFLFTITHAWLNKNVPYRKTNSGINRLLAFGLDLVLVTLLLILLARSESWLEGGYAMEMVVASLTGCIIAAASRLCAPSRTACGIYHLMSSLTWASMSCGLKYVFLPQLIAITVIFGLGFLTDFLSPDHLENEELPLARQSLFPSLTFSWLNRLVRIGRSRRLVAEDLWQVSDEVSVQHILHRLHAGPWKQNRGVSFTSFLLRAFRWEISVTVLLEIVSSASRLVQPWLLKQFLVQPSAAAIVWMLVARLVNMFSNNQGLSRLRILGINIRSALTASVYERSFAHSALGDGETDSAANLAEVDTLRIHDFMPMLHSLWAIPVQCAISIWFLTGMIGWQSTCLAVVVLCVALSIAHFVSNHLRFGMKELMEKRDIRIAKVVEVIDRIKAIQLYCWEQAMGASLDEARGSEMRVLSSLAQAQGAIFAVTTATPDLMTSVAFAIYWLRRGNLSGDVIFSSLGFFTLISGALATLPSALTLFFACQTSFNRIRDFLLHPELTFGDQEQVVNDSGGPRLLVHQATFGVGTLCLVQNAELDLSRPGLVTISGPVGVGKSTMLKGLTGSLQPFSGHVIAHGRREYMPQAPFIIRGSLRDNILFGRRFHAAWYHRVLNACALDLDVSGFPQGDMTDLSDAGIALSGGQKSRICLARAVYARADLYFLDDPLAALDSAVKEHIIHHVFGAQGLLKHSIRIVSTNSTPLVAAAQSQFTITSQNLVLVKTEPADTADPSTPGPFDDMKPPASVLLSMAEVEPSPDSSESATDEEIPPTNPPHEPIDAGQVGLSTYLTWLRLARPTGWVAVIFLTGLGKISNVFASYNLELLSHATGARAWVHIGTVAGSGLMQGLFSWLFIWVTYHLCLLPAARGMHAGLVDGVLKAPLSFYTRTPAGRILNRFTNDMSKVDGSLASNLLGAIMMGSNLIMALTILLHTSALAGVYLVPFAGLYWILQSRYLNAVRDLKRLEIESRSPIITSIQEAVAGYRSIVVSGQRGYFLQKHYAAVNENIRASIPMYCLEYWLSLRLEFIAGLIVALTASLLLWLQIESARLGFVMNYVMQISAMLANIIRYRTNLEIDIISVERIKEYFCESEAGHPGHEEDTINSLPPLWPSEGVVRFDDFSAGYDKGVPVLENISLKVKAGERIAIVGRTGSGKTSLALSLARMIEGQSGGIYIDGVDIAHVPVHELRNHVAMIPQEPAIFTGTLRYNLDPNGEHSETRLRDAVHRAGLRDAFKCEWDLLDYVITDGGRNLSAGQSQLVAIARVLLANAKIIIMDEATAALDAGIDEQLQRVLRDSLRERTVFTITHKPGNYMNYDRVLVLGAGRVVSFDTPSEFLVAQADSGVLE